MANWQKVVTSGSNAHLNMVTASFFSGDGSGLTGITATMPAGVYSSSAQEKDPIFTSKSGSYATTGSNIFFGNQQIVGSVTASIFSASYMDFNNLTAANVPAWKAGRIYYDSDLGAFTAYNSESEVSLQIGQEIFLRAFNKSGATILNGTPVRISGSQGDMPYIWKATTLPAEDRSQNRIIGVATHDIETNSVGYLNERGIVRDINTTRFQAGDVLFVSSSVGELTNIEPPFPHEKIKVGFVVRSHTNGMVFVSPDEPKHVHDLIEFSSSVFYNNDLWVYDASVPAWKATNKGLLVSGSFSGSFQGNGGGITGIISSSYAITSSYSLVAQTLLGSVVSASYAETASYLNNQARYFAHHNQSSQAVTWSFQHNLGNQFPVVTVWNTNNEVVIPEKIYAPTANLTYIYFPTSQSGFVAATIGSILPSGPTGSFSGSFVGDGSGLTGVIATLPNNIFSSSQQVDFNGINNKPFIISSSQQIATDISGSFTSFSSSANIRFDLIENKTGSYATTGSNIFKNNQIITGSLTVSGSIFISSGNISGSYIGNGSGLTGIISSSYAMTSSYAIKGGSQVVGINSQVGTTYTLSLSDAGKYIRMDNASPITLTIPLNASIPFETGSVISAIQIGAGVVTVSGSGIIMNAFGGRKTAGQYAVVQMVKVDTNTWDIIGGIA